MTAPAQPAPGPARPLPTTPPRAPGTVRRTTTIDVTRPEGLTGPVVALLAGRDVVTDAAGRPTVIDRVALAVRIDLRTGAIRGIGAGDLDERDAPGGAVGRDPLAGLDDLVGATVRSGFARRVAATLPDEAEQRSLRHALFEDLPGAFLVSGYSLLRAGLLAGDVELAKQRAHAQADICVGWAAGGPVHAALADHGHTAVPGGPDAPALDGDDPHGWHPVPPPADGTVRRRRRLDVARGDGPADLVARSHLRDSYAGDGPEMVMHEYAVEADIDGGRIAAVRVDPLVLPWLACPGAAASAERVVGVALADLGPVVRTDLVGPSTCTHLTSTIRSLLDVRALAPALPPGDS